MNEFDADAERVRRLLVEGGFGPTLETGDVLLFLAAELYVREGHAQCAVSLLETHLAGWANAPREKPALTLVGREDDKG